MNFKFEDKEYDDSNLSDKGKLIVAKLQGIVGKKNQLSLEFSDLQILESHYNKLLKEELSKEKKTEVKK
jgi:hypothetical protein